MKRVIWILSTLCLVLGGLFSVIPGLRFGGLLFLCMAAFLAVLAALGRLAETRRWAKVCRAVLLALFCVGLACFCILEGFVIAGSDGDAEDVPVSCVVILGAGVEGTRPSLMLWSRLDAALDYIADKPDIPVIVSGSQGAGEQISEAECMYRWLVDRGVDGSRIWKEEKATSTRTNFRYSFDLMAERGIDKTDDFAFVTNSYHICRAQKLAGVPGAHGVAATLPRGLYYDTLTVNYYVREAFALANELLFKVDLDI